MKECLENGDREFCEYLELIVGKLNGRHYALAEMEEHYEVVREYVKIMEEIAEAESWFADFRSKDCDL